MGTAQKPGVLRSRVMKMKPTTSVTSGMDKDISRFVFTPEEVLRGYPFGILSGCPFEVKIGILDHVRTNGTFRSNPLRAFLRGFMPFSIRPDRHFPAECKAL